MPDINCIFTKVLIPYLEREVGPAGVTALTDAAGHTREYLTADHNWVSVGLADRLMHVAMGLLGERDEEAFTRRLWEFGMNWKPREERSYLGTYSMGIGDPRTLFARQDVFMSQIVRCSRFEVLEIGRRRARFRSTPLPGVRIPRWVCLQKQVSWERFPTNWGLPRARVTEARCAARGAEACVWEVTWRNPSLGRRFWTAVAGGGLGAGLVALGLAPAQASVAVTALAAALPAAAGVAVGVALRERDRRRHTQRLLDLQGDEVIYSNNELEKKFRDLETRIEQLSLLSDLSAAVNATLDPERIYEQALDRLVARMGYEKAHLFLVDAEGAVLRGHRRAGGTPDDAVFEGLELPLDAGRSASARAVLTGRPVHVADVDTETEPVHQEAVRAHRVRSFVAVPLHLESRTFGVISITSREPGRYAEGDVELLTAVANHVALAVERAESFQTIEELSRGLEQKVRVRTEQLRAANEELQAAYRDLQATQVQLVQREKMASVGQLVAGVAHELNNPIGFVSSNVTTLEDFVTRLRTIVETYRQAALPAAERARLDARWAELKLDYALKYLTPMIEGIREGAERTRKIVRDLRVFARTGDDVWQAVHLREELESSLTLLSHLLKDRIVVERKFGELAPVDCVRSQIDQVFLNILANAAQAIVGEGTITIETRQEDGTAVVAVADTGPGIAPDVAGRIFDPFFTTKPVGEGTGLGLSISYEILKKHGGDLVAESRPGRGATFTVRIPITRKG